MYGITPGEKLATGIAAVAICAALGCLLIAGLAVSAPLSSGKVPAVFALTLPAPPPPVRERPPPKTVEKPGRQAMATSAKAARLTIRPAPAVLPIPLPIIVMPAIRAPIPAGIGTADGAGDGQDSEGAGQGDGAGNGDGDTPPRLRAGRLGFSDLPAALRTEGAEQIVAVRYAVEVDGRVDHCLVTASSGNRDLDGLTCRLIEQRFRFDPSRDDNGRPVRSIIEERHSWRLRPAKGQGE